MPTGARNDPQTRLPPAVGLTGGFGALTFEAKGERADPAPISPYRANLF